MNYNIIHQDQIGTSLSSLSGERYPRSEEALSAPGYLQGGTQSGATTTGRDMQLALPAGSDVHTGLLAPTGEPGDEDGPQADTSPVLEDGPRPTPPGTGSSRVPTREGTADEPNPDQTPKGKTSRSRPKEKAPRRTNQVVRVATLNIRGCGGHREGRRKLQEAVRWMRDTKTGVLALQETYACEANFTNLEEFNAKVWTFANPGNAHSAGTGFIVHREFMPPSLKREDFEHEVLREGRLDCLKWKQRDSTIEVANLYAPNNTKAAQSFFADVTRLLKPRKVDIVLGDWNHVELGIDRMPERAPSAETLNALKLLKQQLAIEDSWRDENPHTRDFTFETPSVNGEGETSRSRLDRILLTEEMATRSTAHDIDVSLQISDHYPVRVSITDSEAPEQGRPRWRMNLEDLEDTHAMEKCRLILLKCQRTTGKNRMNSWLAAKESIRRACQEGQTMRRKERGKTLSSLKDQRDDLINRSDFGANRGLRAQESNLRERIGAITKAKLERASESSAARFAEKGEAVNSYFFSIGKALREESTIWTLQSEDGETITDSTDMAETARAHHAKLQTAQPLTPDRLSATKRMENLATGKRFTEEARKELDSEVSPEEAEEIIMSSQNGKAPGKDGIPYEFYKYWVKRARAEAGGSTEFPDITGILAGVWNLFGEGYVAPTAYVEGLMFLLYKKKRRDKVENYRPITLLGCDYKMQTKVMARRLGRNVHGVLHPDQAGFVPERDILDHVKLAKHVKELCDASKRDGALVALDQEKAYDRIDHAYLWRMMIAFGLPPKFINTVQALYQRAKTRVLVNQMVSEPFEVRRGVRQGDPLSCLLFNLAIEPLAESLRKSNLKGISIPDVMERLVVRLFADDTQVYLSKFDSWSRVRLITDDWCLASTAKFNAEKTEVLPMGSTNYRKRVCEARVMNPDRPDRTALFPEGARLIKDHEPLRILGGIVGHQVDENRIWEPVVSKIEQLADKWSKKRLTMRGRRLIISFLLQSRAQYMLSTNDPPTSVIKRVETATHKVMWAGKKRGLTVMEIVERPVSEGGFGVPNFNLRAKAARIMSARKWCAPTTERPLWADVADELIRISSKTPQDPRKISIITQTWKETSGKTSKLPRDLQAMLKELRSADLRVEALRFDPVTREQAPAWLSRHSLLTLKEENSAAMRQLRRAHQVKTMGDVTGVTNTPTNGCRTHLKCIQARDTILLKALPVLNPRLVTPAPEGHTSASNLDFTQRRRKKAAKDAMEGEPTLIDPNFTEKGDLREAIRIFGNLRGCDRMPARRLGPNAVDTEPLEWWTDGSTTDYEKASEKIGFGVWCEATNTEIASRLESEPRTNNRAELFAVIRALEIAQPNIPIIVNTDSQYVMTGMTKTRHDWEDQGWLKVPNADAWKRAIQLLRTRTATTTFNKVPAHTGLRGNEKADELAKAGAEGDLTDEPSLEVSPEWTLEGAKISALTYSSAYNWLRDKLAKGKRTREDDNMERIKEILLDVHHMKLSTSRIWLSLRAPYIRKEIGDFLWAMIHGRSPCGTMFAKWGGEWEDLQYCDCGAIETMEHILTQCDNALWRINLWDEMADLLKSAKIIPTELCRRPYFGEIMGVGAIKLPTPEATRLWATVLSETAFTVWKLRNRRRFDQARVSPAMAINVWHSSLEKRARTDLATGRLKGPASAPQIKRRKEAETAWEAVLSIKGRAVIWNYMDHG